MITIKTRFGVDQYNDEEQIYPYGHLEPGNYRELSGCCSGCRASIERGGPLLDGHFACSGVAFDSGKEIIAEELVDGDWIALVRE
jgi:hypothetical protein